MGLTRSSRKIDGLKLSGLLIGGLASETQHESLCPDQEDPRRLHAASTPPPRRRHQTTRRISEDGSWSSLAPQRPARRRESPRREAFLLNPPLMTDVEN